MHALAHTSDTVPQLSVLDSMIWNFFLFSISPHPPTFFLFLVSYNSSLLLLSSYILNIFLPQHSGPEFKRMFFPFSFQKIRLFFFSFKFVMGILYLQPSLSSGIQCPTCLKPDASCSSKTRSRFPPVSVNITQSSRLSSKASLVPQPKSDFQPCFLFSLSPFSSYGYYYWHLCYFLPGSPACCITSLLSKLPTAAR